MLRPDISKRAYADLSNIWDYIARESVEAADRVTDELEAAINRLCEFPESGHAREDLTDRPLKFWTVRKFMIVYQRRGRRLRVIRILHGMRNIGRLLE